MRKEIGTQIPCISNKCGHDPYKLIQRRKKRNSQATVSHQAELGRQFQPKLPYPDIIVIVVVDIAQFICSEASTDYRATPEQASTFCPTAASRKGRHCCTKSTRASGTMDDALRTEKGDNVWRLIVGSGLLSERRYTSVHSLPLLLHKLKSCKWTSCRWR